MSAACAAVNAAAPRANAIMRTKLVSLIERLSSASDDRVRPRRLARAGPVLRPARYVYCDKETTVLRQSLFAWRQAVTTLRHQGFFGLRAGAAWPGTNRRPVCSLGGAA